jgi:hypothetical protein
MSFFFTKKVLPCTCDNIWSSKVIVLASVFVTSTSWVKNYTKQHMSYINCSY